MLATHRTEILQNMSDVASQADIGSRNIEPIRNKTSTATPSTARNAPDSIVMDGYICRAARGFLDWTAPRLSREAEVPVAEITAMERNRTTMRTNDTARRVQKAFEKGGIVFVPPSKGGPGILRPAKA
jgi:hypothetical protein